MSPNDYKDISLASASLYLIIETGSYASATFNSCLVSTSLATQDIATLSKNGGKFELIDAVTVRFTYEYTGGGDGCQFSVIKLY